MSKNKKLTPLQQLRASKKKLKEQYEQDGDRIIKNWNYLTNNTSTVFLNTLFSSSKKLLEGGIDSKRKIQTPFGSIGSLSSIASSLSGLLPLAWEFAQPILLKYVVKKIKNFFLPKKKKKKSTTNKED